MKSKKRIYIYFSILICLTITLFIYYKINKNGNNINKSIKNFEEYFLNISSYEATVSIEIKSNKNTNKYVVRQWYYSPNIFKQEVQAPENIKGLTIIYNGQNFEIKNSILGLSTIHQKYNLLTNNVLGLNSFIDECRNKEFTKTEQDNTIVVDLETDNKYTKYRKLVINKVTYLPEKMIIMDENKKNLVYILYNDITINNTTEEDIIMK